MVVARKSAVSARGTWFRRDSTPSLEKRRATGLGRAAQSAPTRSAETPPLTAKRQRRSSKNLAVNPTNGSPMPISVKEPRIKQVSNLDAQSSVGLPTMPSSGSAPVWLLRVYTLNRYSSVVAFLLVVATLVVYGWTVYSQELWSQSYRKLQNLQRHERQLTTTNATLTNKMAEEAERPTAGLVSPTPTGTIFLPPAASNSKPISSKTIPNLQIQQQTISPLGY